ncbi:MAG: hypothetical protein ABIR91_06075 [Candidatus Saccharimonadales bacterium]
MGKNTTTNAIKRAADKKAKNRDFLPKAGPKSANGGRGKKKSAHSTDGNGYKGTLQSRGPAIVGATHKEASLANLLRRSRGEDVVDSNDTERRLAKAPANANRMNQVAAATKPAHTTRTVA